MKAELYSRHFSAWVDMFRWLAALAVLVPHVGERMLVRYGNMPVRSWPHLAYAFLSGFDHQAVMVFFVLSGLLVGGSAVREVRETGKLALGRYLAKRFVRLWVVLLPAFALGLACTSVAIRLGAVEAGMLPPGIGTSMTAQALLCNAAFLQNIACEQFSGNLALWSLTNEFWYYVSFPAIALLLFGPFTWGRLGACAASVSVLLLLTIRQFAGVPIIGYAMVWGFGVVAATLDRPVIRRPLVAASVYVGAVLCVRVFVRRQFQVDHPYLYLGEDCLLSGLFTMFLLSLKCHAGLRPPPFPALQSYLAGFSFSLYAINVPLVVLCAAVLMATTGTGWQMDTLGVQPWLAVGGTLVVSVLAGWLFSRVTEVHTDRVRRWLTSGRTFARLPNGRETGPAPPAAATVRSEAVRHVPVTGGGAAAPGHPVQSQAPGACGMHAAPVQTGFAGRSP